MSSEPTTSFSSSGEDAITRTIDIQPDGPDVGSSGTVAFEEFYEIERTAKELVKGGYQRIALQFPDELLHDSVPIFRRLKSRISELDSTSTSELYVLADTSYGSCCVDEVAAQHVNSDVVVHYGHACMTLTSRLPVIYVFGQKLLNVQAGINELIRAFDAENPLGLNEDRKAILIKHDVVYTHLARAILATLRELLSARNPSIPVFYNEIQTSSTPVGTAASATPGVSTNVETTGVSETPGAHQEPSNVEIPLEHTTVFYIGEESLGLTNLLMTNASCDVYTYSPSKGTAVLASGRTNKLLMRRYAAVQKARDADVFGILVGTLGVASYLPLISHLRKLLARRRKKSYTISVGKLNPAKLANFLEVECFVLVACPENSLVAGEKDFLRPIVTPYELEIAMQVEQSWTGRYVLDFGRLLADAKEEDQAKPEQDEGEEGDENDPDRPVFSLITGTYRQAKQYGGTEREVATLVEGTSALVLRNQDGQVAKIESAAGQFLQQRTYRGLEMHIGEDAPSVLEQGRSGIARGYQDDRAHQEIASS
ncbi:hypothetical protein M413DRAFT_443332 [Hebeloma cylindrosporum]|uniref:2-(3-amino-3-carboxypropyl)histidine synthase subunit 2 n=1 Tax=Hebeloma cylindrosporum TaxID=76867 RepID=A0A0C3C622_HEBCY|nr:hypothetical protein M413DRAFT_443332 [Hebeloma cylindrosporum h7]